MSVRTPALEEQLVRNAWGLEVGASHGALRVFKEIFLLWKPGEVTGRRLAKGELFPGISVDIISDPL